jgi:superfamily I DNA/RNA helicase
LNRQITAGSKATDEPKKWNVGGPKPTDEQSRIVEAVCRDSDLSINALAGTGKTTTLKMIADELTSRRGHYIAFNRAIVDEARSKFPSTIQCVTAHGLAFRAVGHRYKGRLKSPQVSADHLAEHFGVESFSFKASGDSFEFEPAQVARIAERTVHRFCKSVESDLELQHVPTVPLIRVGNETERRFQSVVLEIAAKMWSDLLATQGLMRFSHDHYLKMWQLTKPTIPGDIVLFDEAQDADPVMLDVVNAQEGSQLVYCGDTYQSIYEWRGAIDALSLVNVDEALWLTQSFRFGDEIAQVANNFLNLLDSPAKVRGLPSMVSTVGEVVDPAAILCRTNYGVIVSLTEAQSAGQRAALLGNVREDLQAFARGCARLMEGQRTGHPELAPFKDWQAALKWATDEEESASDIAMRIRLVNSIGALKLLRTLDDVVEEDEADVIVSTAHRAKGREWDSVRLAGDYKHPADMSEDELKLTYVSVTRARRELDISNLPTANGEPPRLFQNQLGGSQVASRPKRQRPPINSTVMAPKPVERHGVVGRLLKTNTDDR